jgi:bifunctional ADP-heptose synthase (sugar kinase/adenylyltransferase)
MAKKILVIGDTIIDKTVFTEAIGISLESPTLKTKLLSDEISYGGAANVAKNIARLGSECSFITIGEVDIPEVRTVSLPGTSAKKTRIWVHRRDSDYRHLQINEEASGENKLLLQEIEYILASQDAVVICDYGHGVFDPWKIEKIIQRCNNRDIPIYCSSQISDSYVDYSVFNGADYVVLNSNEFEQQKEAIDSKIIVTQGKAGCSVYYGKKQVYQVPSVSVDAIDTTGAGDCFLAAFCSFGLDEIPALEFANKYAAKSTLVKGTGFYEE